MNLRIDCSFSIYEISFGSFNTESEKSDKDEYSSNKEYNLEECISYNKDEYISDNPGITISNDDKASISKTNQRNNRSRTEYSIYEPENTQPMFVEHLNRRLDYKKTSSFTSQSPIYESQVEGSTRSTSTNNNQITGYAASLLLKATTEDVIKEFWKCLEVLAHQGKIYINSITWRLATNVAAPTSPDSIAPKMSSKSNSEGCATLADLSTNCTAGFEIILEMLGPANKTVQDINAINNISGQQVKLSVRINVISPDNFRDAMRNFQLITYELTYTRVFPKNCRMFIEVPVYKHGYFRHQDDKHAEEKQNL